MEWLWISIVASIVLTVVLNLAIRLWPGGAARAGEQIDRWATEQASSRLDDGGSGPRVFVPWKAMLVGSIVLTIALNLALVLFR